MPGGARENWSSGSSTLPKTDRGRVWEAGPPVGRPGVSFTRRGEPGTVEGYLARPLTMMGG
jgi:hypothetical protein